MIARLQELDGSEEQRISLLSAESDLHPRLIRIALDYAAEAQPGLGVRLKKNLPAGGGQAAELARILDRWDREHPDPYLGHHATATAFVRGVDLGTVAGRQANGLAFR